MKDMEQELLTSTQKLHTCSSEKEFTVQTKDGTRYLNSVRALYYNLMTIGIAPDKIESVIRAVLNKLCPSLDVISLKLPKKKLCQLHVNGRNAYCQ